MDAATSRSSATILVVDDDAGVAWALEQALTAAGYAVKIAADAGAARRVIRRGRPDLVLTDVRMPGESGLDLLAFLHGEYPGLPVIVSTAHGTMETAITAVQRGAFDYLTKPLDLDRTLAVVRRALDEDRLAASATPATSETADGDLIGATPAMQEVFRRIAAAAASDLGVLITGPTGSGKELVARALHRHSRRSGGPFVAVNCGALPETLVERELFGHEAGAYTDAKLRGLGRIEAAQGGTLFLDEIGELPLPAQAKLLRVLEDHRITRVGGSDEIPVDVRVIAATNRDLARQVSSGAFRDDLAWRLKVMTIDLPPLAERLDDLPALVRHVLSRAARRLGRRLALTDAAMQRLQRHAWPGNVRELKHVLEEAAVLATGGIIAVEHLSLPPDAGPSEADADAERADGDVGKPPPQLRSAASAYAARLMRLHAGHVHARYIDALEEILIREAIARTEGNQLRAAELLGINRITVKKRMDDLGITK